MNDLSATTVQPKSALKYTRHKGWVRVTHWLITLSFFVLVFSGVEILMVHPRLYWGDAGNDLTPALFELPISRNYKHHGWEKAAPFFRTAAEPVSASRTYDIFNQNGWGRSLHFLAGWVLVLTGLFYLLAGIFSGHFKRDLLPRIKDFSSGLIRNDFISHFRKMPPAVTGRYGLLQQSTYTALIFFIVPADYNDRHDNVARYYRRLPFFVNNVCRRTIRPHAAFPGIVFIGTLPGCACYHGYQIRIQTTNAFHDNGKII